MIFRCNLAQLDRGLLIRYDLLLLLSVQRAPLALLDPLLLVLRVVQPA